MHYLKEGMQHVINIQQAIGTPTCDDYAVSLSIGGHEREELEALYMCLQVLPKKELIVGACRRPNLVVVERNKFGNAFMIVAKQLGKAKLFLHPSWIVLDSFDVMPFMKGLLKNMSSFEIY